jgi:transposase
MMSRRKNRKYDAVFKKEAVALALSSSKPVVEVASDLGVPLGVLYTWIRLSRKEGIDAFPSSGKRSSVDEETIRLRKEVLELRLERDILKKAVAIFSRTPE